MVSPDRPQWAEKLRFWLTDTGYERLDKRLGAFHNAANTALRAVESRIENGMECVETAGLWALCRVYGHKPVADQCNRPEHDFCVYCSKRMPGTAHGPQY